MCFIRHYRSVLLVKTSKLRLTCLPLCARLQWRHATTQRYDPHAIPLPWRQTFQKLASTLGCDRSIDHHNAGLVQQLQAVAVICAHWSLPADGEAVGGVIIISLEGCDSGWSCGEGENLPMFSLHWSKWQNSNNLSGALPVLPVAVLLLLSFPLIDWTVMV